MAGRLPLTDEWDPVCLSTALHEYEDAAASGVARNGAQLDLASSSWIVRQAVSLIDTGAADLVSDDTLPLLSHAILGTPYDSVVRRRLISRLTDFAQPRQGCRVILQHDPEGDFHPWQSFAYLVLVDGDAGSWRLTADAGTVSDLAEASTDLNVDRGEELGHCLLASSLLFSDGRDPTFRFADRQLELEGLVREAARAQWFGDFEVCRKFHLTSGLASITASRLALRRYRVLAAAAVQGQLRVLKAVAVLSRALIRAEAGSMVDGLRHTLGLSDLFEDHLFYAGHLLEVFNIAHQYGYRTVPEWYVRSLINDVNSWLLPRLVPATSIRPYTVQLSHYVRGIVTFAARRRLSLDYTSEETPLPDVGVVADSHAFAPSPPAAQPVARPEFSEALTETARRVPWLQFRGTFPHFRRARPEGWPRSLHYELLDYGDWIGAELHIEDDEALWARPVLRQAAESMPLPPAAHYLQLDDSWWGERGRVRILFPPGAAHTAIATGLRALVVATERPLSRLAVKLATSPACDP